MFKTEAASYSMDASGIDRFSAFKLAIDEINDGTNGVLPVMHPPSPSPLPFVPVQVAASVVTINDDGDANGGGEATAQLASMARLVARLKAQDEDAQERGLTHMQQAIASIICMPLPEETDRKANANLRIALIAVANAWHLFLSLPEQAARLRRR